MTSSPEIAEEKLSGLLRSTGTSWLMTVSPINERITRSPAPGQPRAKCVKECRKQPPVMELNAATKLVESPKGAVLTDSFE